MSARRSIATLAALALVASGARAQVDFDTGRALPAAGDGKCLALADVDEDSRLDVIVLGAPGLLFVHSLGDPFAPPGPRFEWSVPGMPRLLAAGDVDADGHADVVVVYGTGVSTTLIGVLFGDGRGGASFVVLTSTIGAIRSLALLDADGDSLLDIAAAFQSSQTIEIVVHDRASPRSFLPESPAPFGGKNAQLAAGDFDGDGAADLAAVGEEPLQLTLLLGDGAGGFPRSRSFRLNRQATSIVAADFDRDGLDDVVATDGHLFSLRGDASSGLIPAWVGPDLPRTFELTAGDIDGDGIADLVSAGLDLVQWLNDGTGAFAPTTEFVQRRDAALAIGDVDGDGVADVVGSRNGVGTVDVLTRTTGGGFLRPIALDVPTSGFGEAADLNDDGAVDLVLAGTGTRANRAVLFFGDGRGGFLDVGEAALRSQPARVRAADVVGDSSIDLVLPNSNAASVTVFRNDGGSFVDWGDVRTGSAPFDVDVGDIDGDGAADLATAEGRPAFTVGFGDGQGAFFTTSVVCPIQREVAVGDLDADGFADVVLATSMPPGISVAFGSAIRSLALAARFEVGPEPKGLVVADVDLDGNLDVLVGDGTQAIARVLFGDGAGGIARTLSIATPLAPASTSLGDATGDGIPDLVVAHSRANSFSVLAGDGRGGFLPATTSFLAPGGALHAFATDLGDDGVREVVVPGYGFAGGLFRPRETRLAASLRGAVNAGHGPAWDVVFVNGRSGGTSRTVALRPSDSFEISVRRPPLAVGLAPFAIYAWAATPTEATVRDLQRRLGAIALPMPLAPGSPAPSAIWNNTGRPKALGVPTRASSPASSPAPTTFFRAPRGAGGAITFTLQGIIVDPGAPNGRAAVTNGVVVEVR